MPILTKCIFVFVCWDGYCIQGHVRATKAESKARVEKREEAPFLTSFSSAFPGKQARVTQLNLGVGR